MDGVMQAILDRIRLTFRMAPRCDWVQSRIPSYIQWDISLTPKEFRAVDRHVAICPKCTAEAQRIEPVLAALEKVAEPAAEVHLQPELIANAVFARLASSDSEAHTPRLMGQRLRPVVWATVTACILIVAVPVLAYVGSKVIDYFQAGQDDGPVLLAQQHAATAQLAFNNPTPAAPNLPSTLPKAMDTSQSSTAEDLDRKITRLADEAAARAEIDAMLPHTEEEYEAWARKEYPHIMALYDVLTKPGFTEAERASSADGGPAPFLPRAWSGLPEDVQALLNQYSQLAKTQDKPLWDGIPVNIPDWGKRLYANTPEPERPIGWRALLIYSGETLKLDWPQETDEPNVHPTLDGTLNAALNAGCANEPNARFQAAGRPEMPNGYLEIMASNIALADGVLGYVGTSCRLIATRQFEDLAKNTAATQLAFHDTRNPECAVHTRLQSLSTLFDSREEMLRLVETNGKETGNG